MITTIFFLGRNTEKIIQDAERFLGDLGRVITIIRDDETLPIPKIGGEAICVGNLPPSYFAGEVRVVANGGTTAQVVPVLLNLTSQYWTGTGLTKLQFLDVQYDGVRKWSPDGDLLR